jgi:hypothetical protein
MRALVLKVGATVLTLSATIASAWYVTAHLKNPSAPLQPPVLASHGGGSVTLGPSVHEADVQPVTSTYAS